DIDIVNTNSGSGNLSLMLNDGNGVFGPPTFFEGGGLGEWGLASGDFNEDGIIDLAIGARTSQQLIIGVCNGDGTFTTTAPHAIGGAVWMLVVGDVNGDGHEDVVAANSSSNNGSVVRGDGALGFLSPLTYATDPFPLATDLGDLDGDGDLDWSVSCFQGDWFNFRNTGIGSYTFAGEFNAPANASCTVLMDIDNDGDLDQALIDEIDDLVIIQQNDGVANPADVNADGVVDVQDLTEVILAWGECPAAGPCAADLNGDGVVDVQDLTAVVLGWG
ncbi:MAG: FG-GAP-like repeat-containing protein, partial [Planctomycetota bacterium]